MLSTYLVTCACVNKTLALLSSLYLTLLVFVLSCTCVSLVCFHLLVLKLHLCLSRQC